jgi:serine/threonine protein kinase
LDIWALGISILHLYLGRAPIVDRPDIQKSLSKLEKFEEGKDDLGLSEITDKKLQRLVASMLSKNSLLRPNIVAIQLALSLPF